jgi:hypothetical protein
MPRRTRLVTGAYSYGVPPYGNLLNGSLLMSERTWGFLSEFCGVVIGTCRNAFMVECTNSIS